MAHTRQSRPDSGLAFHVKVRKTFKLFPLRSEAALTHGTGAARYFALEDIVKSQSPLQGSTFQKSRALPRGLSQRCTPPSSLAWWEGGRKGLKTRHTLEPLAWHWSHWYGRLVNRVSSVGRGAPAPWREPLPFSAEPAREREFFIDSLLFRAVGVRVPFSR